MKVLLISTALMISPVTFAESRYDCKQLINSNSTGKALIKAKAVDMQIDLEEENGKILSAEMKGDLVAKASLENESPYIPEGEIFPVNMYEVSAKKLSLKQNVLSATFFERQVLFCEFDCRVWDTIKLNLKTQEVEYIARASNKAFGGDIRTVFSVKAKCTKTN